MEIYIHAFVFISLLILFYLKDMKSVMFLILLVFVLLTPSFSDPSTDLISQLNQLVDSRSLRGLQIQITKNGQQIFYLNKGIKNELNEPIDPNTIFRIASCSKSFSSVAIMQLVEQGKLRLTDTVSSILGFQVKNPHFPDTPITIEMILSHQSSITQPDVQYDNFLTDSYNAKTGDSIPDLKELFVPGGKYYNSSIFPSNRKPGEYFHYSNLGFVIAGTIVERVTGQRFDLYMKENVLNVISEGLVENATYNVATIQNYKNLGTIYVGNKGKWVPNNDNYNGPIPARNLTGYKIGSNGAVFGPQGGLRASVRHMNNYIHIYQNKGMTKTGRRLLTQQSVNEILKPRYQYHGPSGGINIDFHLYGFGLFTTTFAQSDILIQHQVVRGHTGTAYGLISGYHFWEDYTFSYIINGALNGYGYDSTSIYEKERTTIHQSVDAYVQKCVAKVDQMVFE